MVMHSYCYGLQESFQLLDKIQELEVSKAQLESDAGKNIEGMNKLQKEIAALNGYASFYIVMQWCLVLGTTIPSYIVNFEFRIRFAIPTA